MGETGPRPVAKTLKVSPALAGLDPSTIAKSLACAATKIPGATWTSSTGAGVALASGAHVDHGGAFGEIPRHLEIHLHRRNEQQGALTPLTVTETSPKDPGKGHESAFSPARPIELPKIDASDPGTRPSFKGRGVDDPSRRHPRSCGLQEILRLRYGDQGSLDRELLDFGDLALEIIRVTTHHEGVP